MLIQSNNVAPVNGFIFTDTTLVASKEGYAVKIDTGNQNGVILCTAGATPVGVIPDSRLYATNQPIGLVGTMGQVAGLYGTFSAGDKLKVTTGGSWITAGATDNYFAQALDTVTAGIGQAIIFAGGAIAAQASFSRSGTTNYPTVAGDIIATGSAASNIITMTTNVLATAGTVSSPNLIIAPQSSGQMVVSNATYAAMPVMSTMGAAWIQGTTNANGVITSGIASNCTTNAKIMICGGSASAVCSVVPSAGGFTCYNATTTCASNVVVNYMIIAY